MCIYIYIPKYNLFSLYHVTCMYGFRADNLVLANQLVYSVDGSFCPSRSHSLQPQTKHTEAYINYKLADLLAQTYY